MIKYIKNNQGITLVELIAALALVSMVAILIMTTLGIGFKHSIAESNKTSAQQEANLIVSKLMNQHRKGDCYYIKGASGGIMIAPVSSTLCTSTTEPPASSFKPVSDTRFNVTMTSVNQMINPTKNDYTFVAAVKYKNATYKINTILTRYKTTN